MTRKAAVVLFNLGGPDRLEAVRPFLFNLFNDAAIIEAPGPLRWLLAQLISRRRAPTAREIYGQLGGASPLLPNTQAQARALETALGSALTGWQARVFVAMRYWRPRSEETAAVVREFGPDKLVLLPLYPQFSAATSGSSLDDWRRAATAEGLKTPSTAVCCYPRERGFVAEVTERLKSALAQAGKAGRPRVLFSAHGLPKKMIRAGDPYQWQVERSVAAVLAALNQANLDWRVCYQSRVGPLEWIGPATDEEIERGGREGVPLVVVPIAFVSEHSETLVELDIEYEKLARASGAPAYVRVPTVTEGPAFIKGLARLVREALEDERTVRSGAGDRICPSACVRCPLAG